MVALRRSEVEERGGAESAGEDAHARAEAADAHDEHVQDARSSAVIRTRRGSGEWVCAGSASPSWTGRVVRLAKARGR
jgi:hypothetical protein